MKRAWTQRLSMHGWSKEALVIAACAAFALGTSWTVGPVTTIGGVALHAGIAVAVFWAGQRSQVWCALVGMLASHVAVFAPVTSWQPLTAAHACVLTLVMALQGWFGALCLRRFVQCTSTLDSARAVLLFLGCSALGSSLVSAMLLPLWLLANGLILRGELIDQVVHVWLTMATGVVLGAPLLLAFVAEPTEAWRPRRSRLGVPLLVGMGLIALAFSGASGPDSTAQPAASQHHFKLLLVLLFASMLSGFLLIVTGRMARIEAVVVARTADLAGINKYLISEINSRWEAQRALAASDARWQFALESADTGVLDWDVSSRRMFYSAKWKQLLGYPEDAEGPSMDEWVELVHPEDRERCRTQLALLLNGSSALFQLEHRMQRKDGTNIWTATRGTVVLRGPNGRALRVIGTQADISVRKENEQELLRHRDHLDDLVRVRTHDLEQARMLAQRADSSKSLFLRNMSHELKTPLHSILSFAQLGGELQEECSRDYFARIVASAQKLDRLVGNVLELASLEIGDRPLHKSVIDLEELIRDVGDELRELFATREQTLCFDVPKDVVSTTLEGDTLRLRSLYRHLLANASRYSPHATTITVSFARCPASDAGFDMLEIRVIDQGIGIASDETETIFQSFEEGSRTRSNAGGTGIGLAVCRAIVLQHGGSIRAQSNEDVGATIVVCLPAPSIRPLSFAS